MFETIKRYLTPSESIDSTEAKKIMADLPEGEYTLLDVRQPKEYEGEHIPGAKLLPIAQLPDQMQNLDPDKPVIVY